MKIRKKKKNKQQASSLLEMFGLYKDRCLIMAFHRKGYRFPSCTPAEST